MFRLLRHHAKHNRAQLDELFPRGTELTVNQVGGVLPCCCESGGTKLAATPTPFSRRFKLESTQEAHVE